MNKKRKKSIRTKILIYPLIAVFIGILIIGGFSTYYTRKSLINEMKTQGLLTSQRITKRISDNDLALEKINNMLEDKIRSTARIVFDNEDKLSNDYLREVMENIGVDELNWYNPEGVILYSNVKDYVDWAVPDKHPLRTVINGADEIMEDVRKDQNSDNYYKYGAVKNENGDFVQVGISANTVTKLKEKFSYQSLVKDIAKDNSIIYATVLDKEAVIIASNDLDDIGAKEDDIGSITGAVDGKPYTSVYYADWIGEDVYDVVYPLTIDGKHVGAINLGYSMDNIRKTSKRNILIIAGIGLIVFIFLGTLLYLFSNQIVVSIKNLSQIIDKLSNYDLRFNEDSEAVKYLKRDDEIGQITKSLSKMQKSFIEIVKNVSNASQNVSSSSEELTAMSNQSKEAANEVAQTIQEIANGANDQAKETTDGAEEINNLEKVINSEIKLVKTLDDSANEVDKLKEQGFNVLNDLEQKTNENNQAASEVQNIIIKTNKNADKIESASGKIQEIAEQTNLLALNASIEAARAGEAGKGFAVVADEIRNLAEETNEFASQISNTIDTLSNMTDKGVKTMEKASKIVTEQSESLDNTHNKFEGISEAIERVKDVVNELNDSTEIMTDKKTEIINIIENLSAISQENAAGTEQASASVQQQTASMEQISDASESLSKLAEDMQETVSKFKI